MGLGLGASGIGMVQQHQPSTSTAAATMPSHSTNGGPAAAAAAAGEGGSSTAAGAATTTAPSAGAGGGGGYYMSLLTSNPYFHAGAGLYTLTVAAVLGRYGLKIVQTALRRKFVVSIETTNRDASFEWLMQWVSRHPHFSVKQLSVLTSNVTIHANDGVSAECTFAPCPNIPHLLIHNGWPIVINRKRQVERAAGSDVLEVLEMKTVGLSRNVVEEIVADARRQATSRDSDKTVIYQNAGGRWIRVPEARSRRPLNSVVLGGEQRGTILSDVQLFLKSQDYYRNLGVPYRRGYLLHGPPGCGKSSLVMALAGELRLAICILSLSNRSLDDESLNSLLNSAPLRSVVLMEDIDRAFTNDSRVTMSGLLNALDGVAAQEGRLVFMTTNHVERLDAALIRPGRADLKMEIGYVTRPQAFHFFKKFFPASSDELADKFAEEIPDGVISVAQIQSHLFLHRNDAAEAASHTRSFVESVHAFEQQIEAARERDRKIRSVRPPPIL